MAGNRSHSPERAADPEMPHVRQGQAGVVILGMHRSGTSCLAGMLQAAGFFAGEVSRWDGHNRKGNREDPRINDLNERVLQISEGSWDDPPARIRWTPEAATERDALLQMLWKSPVPWMFKDPRTLLTWPFWLDAGGMPLRLGIWRDPLSVAQSLATRNGLAISRGLELWVAYNAALIREHERAAFPVVCFDLPRDEFIAAVRAALSTIFEKVEDLRCVDLHRLDEFFDDSLINQAAGGDDVEAIVRGLPDVHAALARQVSQLRQALCGISDFPTAVSSASSGDKPPSGAMLHGLVRIEQAEAAGDLEAAWRACNEMLVASPRRADLWLRLVKLARESGNSERLVSSVRGGLAALPEDPYLWLEQARLHWKNRSLDEAFAAAERAAVCAPEWPKPRQQLGAWAAARKRWPEVEKWLAPLGSEGTIDSRNEVLRGVAAIHLGEIERGNGLIAKAMESVSHEGRVDALHRWGMALQYAGKNAEARDRLMEAFSLAPADAGVAASLSALLHESGNAPSALATVGAAIRAGADSAKLRVTSARIQQEMGHDPDAEIAAGLQLDPRHPVLRRLAGERAYRKGEFDRALEHFLVAAAGPGPIAAMLGAARCHLKLGDHKSAAMFLDQLLGMKPGHAAARRLRDEVARL